MGKWGITDNDKIDEIKIVNQAGQIIKKFEYLSDNQYIVSDLSKGFYNVIVKKVVGNQIFKLIVN